MNFRKMQGAGNDFCLIDGFQASLPEGSPLALAVCDRHFGVGADGMIICLPSETAEVKMVYYNSDGSSAAMCGNGIRCLAKFAYEKGYASGLEFRVETLAGIQTVRLSLGENGEVQAVAVSMGKPLFEADQIPARLVGQPILLEAVEVLGQWVMLSALRIGEAHCVILVEDWDQIDVNVLGAALESHSAFPEKTNVNFMKVCSPEKIQVKTWESGAGRTLACGTGCCAGVVVGRLLGLLERRVEVEAEGGLLLICVDEENEVTMEGPAQTICEGRLSPWLMKQVGRIGHDL